MASSEVEVTLHVDASQVEDMQDLVCDAERYRWLRKQHWYSSKFAVVMNPRREVLPGAYCPFKDELDRIIDEARRDEQQT